MEHTFLLCYFASGITSAVGEQCLVASAAGLGLEPCLDAVAAGDGREVMQFDEDSSFLSIWHNKNILLNRCSHLLGYVFSVLLAQVRFSRRVHRA